MLYLEDYLEMIEHLPQEFRDRFTEIREMDLQVQNSTDNIEKQIKQFFLRAKKMKPQERDAEHAAILKEYYKSLEDADEKVQLVSQFHDLLERYIRKLDQELEKFKLELEADNKGVTEILEKRSLELDNAPPNSSQKENRYSYGVRTIGSEKRPSIGPTQTLIEKKATIERPPSHISESRSSSTSMALVPASPISFSLSHIGAGSTAIAAAASQAIAATQQMQQGRRTASLKASYEAIHNTGVHPHELSIGRELAGAAQSAIAAAILPDSTKKQKKRSSSIAADSSAAAILAAAGTSIQQILQPVAQEDESFIPMDTDGDGQEFPYDPNEPRYCLCDQVSYGDMVACDNADCPFEWFHYQCVQITAPPKGKWYCPQCSANMKRRGPRK